MRSMSSTKMSRPTCRSPRTAYHPPRREKATISPPMQIVQHKACVPIPGIDDWPSGIVRAARNAAPARPKKFILAPKRIFCFFLLVACCMRFRRCSHSDAGIANAICLSGVCSWYSWDILMSSLPTLFLLLLAQPQHDTVEKYHIAAIVADKHQERDYISSQDNVSFRCNPAYAVRFGRYRPTIMITHRTPMFSIRELQTPTPNSVFNFGCRKLLIH